MDGLVSEMYAAMEAKDHLSSTLLVLLGDHGMNDAGNHGGSAPGETSPALVFISPKLKTINPGLESPAAYKEDFRYYSFVEQSDIAPTLGALLGFPVPKNNLGAIIPDFLSFWPSSEDPSSWVPSKMLIVIIEIDRANLLSSNARQILNVIIATFPSFEEISFSGDCNQVTSDITELACRWREIQQMPEGIETSEWTDATTKVCFSYALEMKFQF